MTRNFTKLYCLLLCFGCIAARAQVKQSSFARTEQVETPVTESGIIRGHIATTDNKPAAEVNIQLKETYHFAVTDENGNFVLKNLKAGKHILVISMVGIQTIEKEIAVETNKISEVEFTLPETAKQLEEVLVTTHRTLNEKAVSIGRISIDPKDLPQSIAVVPQSVIRDQQAIRLSDVIRNVNGVYLSSTRGNSQETFSARGYSFSTNNLFKNGARVNPNAMPEMSSLEKVEVLKGSAAILYGNVTPGGIVNMVTKQPKFKFGGEVSMRAGSYGLFKPSFDVYGPVTSSVAYRVDGTFETADSYRDIVHSKRYYINPSVLLKLSKQTELVLQADYLYHTFTPDFGIGTINNTIIPNLLRSTFLGTAWSYAHTKQATASAILNHQFNESWKLNFSASYQNYSRDYYATERIQADSTGKWARNLNRTFTKEDYLVAQVNLNGKFKTGSMEHSLLTGIDADRYYTTNDAFNQPTIYDTINILDASKFTARTDIPSANKIRRINTPINRFGVYIQDLVSLTDKLKLLAGVRFSYQNAQAIDSTNLLTGAHAKGVSKADQAFSPRLGVVYRPTVNTSLFASYSNSFSINSGTDIYFNALAPSIIDQYEIGIKNDFLKGILSANITAYRIKNNNLAQTAQITANGLPNNNTAIKELTGETTSDGVELDLAAHPIAGLDVMAGYSYNYIRYTETSGAKGNFITGERLINSPAQTANATIFYAFKNKKLKGLKVGATAFYTGDRYGGYNNTVGQIQNFSRLIPVAGFTTIDVSAGYTLKKVSFLAKVSNLTNTFNYYVHENYSINPIAPRQFSATASYKF